ncbi:MAG TPA: hypothetical protein VF043_18765 [Ktedonobacteraceae bacterium]|jgi:hypothetical protein
MDELINLITEKTGIPHDTAKQAADVVIGFLKQKLPAPVGSQIDKVVGMQVPAGSANRTQEAMGEAGRMFGNLFGKKDK